MTLLKYWPTSTEVNQCIKPEAEGAHDAVLLAVHQPSPLSYRSINNPHKVATDEGELLDYFTTPNVPTGAHLVPITGASGVGKSHLIRLLAIRLRSSVNAGQYVVIRIPKSASLRRVVELILEPLPDAKYASVKEAFRNALSEVNVETAAMRIQVELEIGLKALAKDLKAKLAGDRTNQAIKEQLHHAQQLPLLLTDSVTVDHFRTAVLPRIVRRAVSGQSAEPDDPTQGQFAAHDLDLPDTIELGKAAHSVQLYYKTALQAREGRGKGAAAEVLNSVVDQATRQLFHLNEALGGMTLQDVILEIRRLLLDEGKDLVILVEDFAALTGIQETLLKVLIQEGVRDGKKQLATMRSAIAVTDGYLAQRDTIATRAMREWIVESHLSTEEEVLRRTRALVASYLNAARWGQARVMQYHAFMDKSRAAKNSWLPPFETDDHDEIAATLSAFGYEGTVPLFPYTEHAIEFLARGALTKGDELTFNPRFIINDVLIKILLVGRQAFVDRQFPPPGFEVRPPSADVAQWLATLQVTDEQRQRYKRFVIIWGNNPPTRNEIGRIPAMLFETFALPRPNIKAIEVDKREKKEREKPADDRKPDDVQRGQVLELKETLEKWVQKGSLLDQAVASRIRTELADALGKRIDWNGERSTKIEIRPNQISIPNARGEGNLSTDAIRIAPDNTDPDGSLRQELTALLRFYHIYKKQTDYEEIEDDLARIGNLLDRLLPQTLEAVRAATKAQLRTATLAVAANSRLLGFIERGRTPSSLSPFLFSEAGVNHLEKLPDDAPIALREWRAAQEEAARIRPELLGLLTARCGCFQGTGKTPNGIDIARLVENYPSSDERLEVATLESLTPDLRQSLTNLSDIRIKAKMKAVHAEIARIKRTVEENLGQEFDRNEIAESLKALAETVKELGVWVEGDIGISAANFKNLCEEFRSAALKEVFAQLERAGDAESGQEDGKSIGRTGQIAFGPLLTAQRFIVSATKLTRSAERHAQTLETQFKGIDPAVEAAAISGLFEQLLGDLTKLEPERT
jgi:hypothetical protein